jgi:hypothetical protein
MFCDDRIVNMHNGCRPTVHINNSFSSVCSVLHADFQDSYDKGSSGLILQGVIN